MNDNQKSLPKVVLLESDIPGCCGTEKIDTLSAGETGVALSINACTLSIGFKYASIYCEEENHCLSLVGSEVNFFAHPDELQSLGGASTKVWRWKGRERQAREIDAELYSWGGPKPVAKALIPKEWSPTIRQLEFDCFSWTELENELKGSGLVVSKTFGRISHANGFSAYTTKTGWVSQCSMSVKLSFHDNCWNRKLHPSRRTGLLSALDDFVTNYAERV
jgi:hypothetical protein